MNPEPLLDTTQMLDVTGGDYELIADLFETFKDEAGRHLKEIRRAWAAGDQIAMRDAAHAIKGSAATMGYVQVREVVQLVEAYIRAGDLEAAISELGNLETSIGCLERAVEEFVRKGRSGWD